MRLVVEHAPRRETWDARASALGGTLFHSHAWALFKCYDGRGQPLFFRWFADGSAEPFAVALGIQRPLPRSISGVLGTRLLFDSSPASLAQDVDFVQSLTEWCRQSRSLVEISLGSYDAPAPWSRRPLPNPTERLEFHLAPRTEEEALRNMRKGARWSIKQATKAGVDVQVTDSQPDLLAFARLYRSTLRRLERTKGIARQSLDTDRFADSLAILTRENRGCLYAASLNGEPVAGCFFGLFEGAAFYLYNGSSEEGLRVGATPLLLFSAARDFSSSGFRRINLGGVAADALDPGSKDHGLYAFKLGFGAEPVHCTSGRLTVKPLRTRIVGLAARLKRGYGSFRARHA